MTKITQNQFEESWELLGTGWCEDRTTDAGYSEEALYRHRESKEVRLVGSGGAWSYFALVSKDGRQRSPGSRTYLLGRCNIDTIQDAIRAVADLYPGRYDIPTDPTTDKPISRKSTDAEHTSMREAVLKAIYADDPHRNHDGSKR